MQLLPNAIEQQKIAKPAIDNAIAKGFNLRTLSTVTGLQEKYLQDIYDGRGVNDPVLWSMLSVHLEQ